MNEQEKLALILHLAQCERCRRDAVRRMRIRHPLRSRRALLTGRKP